MNTLVSCSRLKFIIWVNGNQCISIFKYFIFEMAGDLLYTRLIVKSAAFVDSFEKIKHYFQNVNKLIKQLASSCNLVLALRRGPFQLFF